MLAENSRGKRGMSRVVLELGLERTLGWLQGGQETRKKCGGDMSSDVNLRHSIR